MQGRAPVVAMALAVTLAACTPVATWHLGETAETLRARDVSLTFAGGGGGNADSARCCVAFGTRLRVGVGWRQEVGFHFDGGADFERNYALALAFDYKIGIYRDLVAVVFDVGGSHAGSGLGSSRIDAVASSGALVVSSPHLGRSPVRLFAAGRFAWSVPISNADVYAGFGPTQNLVVPFGFTVEPGNVRLVFEGGVGGLFSEARQAPGNQIVTAMGYYGYGAFTVQIFFRSRR